VGSQYVSLPAERWISLMRSHLHWIDEGRAHCSCRSSQDSHADYAGGKSLMVLMRRDLAYPIAWG
jgi:hypothetical protein